MGTQIFPYFDCPVLASSFALWIWARSAVSTIITILSFRLAFSTLHVTSYEIVEKFIDFRFKPTPSRIRNKPRPELHIAEAGKSGSPSRRKSSSSEPSNLSLHYQASGSFFYWFQNCFTKSLPPFICMTSFINVTSWNPLGRSFSSPRETFNLYDLYTTDL